MLCLINSTILYFRPYIIGCFRQTVRIPIILLLCLWRSWVHCTFSKGMLAVGIHRPDLSK